MPAPCFLSIDIAQYPEKFRRNIAVLVRDYRDSLPEKMRGDKLKLNEFLSRTGVADESEKFTTLHGIELLKFIETQAPLHLKYGENALTIDGEKSAKLLERMIGGLSGFGQVASHLSQPIKDTLKALFGFAAGDAGRSFVEDLEAIHRACPEESRNALAEQIGMGTNMEKRLRGAMEQNQQQLYFAGEFSEEVQSKMTKLCEMVGVAVPQSFEPPIKNSMTAFLAIYDLLARYTDGFIDELYSPEINVKEFLENALKYLKETGNPELQNDPVFQALIAYHEKSKTPDGVTGSGSQKLDLPSAKPSSRCPFVHGGGS